MSNQPYDFIAIGLGPFNLSLACLSEPLEDVKSLFLEQRSQFDWHPGMMLEGVTLQTPFMSDLVTLADPTSKYSFLNYAKLNNRLYPFYIRESFFLLRKEYNLYCQWVCSQLSNVSFEQSVTKVEFCQQSECYTVTCKTPNGEQHYVTRHLVLGTGPAPYIPDCAGQSNSNNVLHSSDFCHRLDELKAAKRVTVVGAGQSAAEIYHTLLQQAVPQGLQLDWIARSPRYFPLEYTKLTLEMTSPEYVDYFYNLKTEQRDWLNQNQKNLFKGINGDLINDIFDTLYAQSLDGPISTTFKTNSKLTNTRKSAGRLVTEFYHHELNEAFEIKTDYLICATGFKYKRPAFLNPIAQQLPEDEQGRYLVSREYAIDSEQKRIFVQNAEQHTHGFVTPDLGMACYRNSIILREILGYAPYQVEQKIAFQCFDLSDVETHSQQKSNAA